MKNLSTLLKESIKEINIQKGELETYLKKFKKLFPASLQRLLQLLDEYDITNAEDLDKIKSASGNDYKNLAVTYNTDEDEIKDIQKLIKDCGENIKMLPQYMTQGIFNAIMQDKLPPTDLLIDTVTPSGRNKAAKAYMGVVNKVVNQYDKRSRLSHSDLMSAASMGLTNALNDWSPEPNDEGKVVSFKTMVGYRVKQAILDEISNNQYTLSGSSYYLNKKYGTKELNTKSIDKLPSGENMNQSHLAALGIEDVPNERAREDLEQLCKILLKKFNERECNVFFRYMGIGGFEVEKSKDIAKSLGRSEGIIRNQYINKMIKYLKSSKVAMELLSELRDIYNESLLCQYWQLTKETIIEKLLNDDVYLLFEEILPWKNNQAFINMHNNAISNLDSDEIEKIEDILSGDFLVIDNNLKKENKLIKNYVKYMYPKTNINNLSDISLLNKMEDLQDAYKKANNIKNK